MCRMLKLGSARNDCLTANMRTANGTFDLSALKEEIGKSGASKDYIKLPKEFTKEKA